MSRGTKLFQQPGSPLIQGRSKQQRPWWQPYVISVVLGLAWPVASQLPHEISESGALGVRDVAIAALALWLDGAVVAVPSVLLGAAIGVAIGGAWGTRYRWVAGTLGAIGTWYAALVLIGLVS